LTSFQTLNFYISRKAGNSLSDLRVSQNTQNLKTFLETTIEKKKLLCAKTFSLFPKEFGWIKPIIIKKQIKK